MIIHEMSEDEKIQEIARLREKALHDEASALKDAKAEGRADVISKGRADTLISIVKKMLDNNTSIETISSYTGLSPDEITKLI